MAALSGSSITQADAFSGFYNLSSSANLKGYSAGFFGRRPYGISEISEAGMAFLYELGSGVMGVACASYGNSDFNRKRINAGYALPLSTRCMMSGGLGFSSTKISNGYGSATDGWINAGFIYDLKKDWKWAGVVDVPMRSIRNEEELPAAMRLGTTYFIGSQVLLSASVLSSTSLNSSFSCNFGLEYLPVESLAIRAGMSSLGHTISFGFGTRVNHMKIDAAAIVHPQLGITPQISIVYGSEN